MNKVPDLKIIEVRKKPDINYKDFVKRSALESDYETLIDESCILVDADTGETLVIYVELPFDDREIIGALTRTKFSKNRRVSGLVTTSRIFGFSPREPRRMDYCTSTSYSREQPKEHAIVCKYGMQIAGLYHEFAPDIEKKHQELMKQNVLDEYSIHDTPFTSGIINKNNPLKYHFDAGNFKNVFSCMAVFKRDVEGGHLSLPEYGLGVYLRPNTVFMFDGQSILHGVTPIKYLSKNAFRYSIVYYSLQRMWNCMPLSEELARIRQVRTTRENNRMKQIEEMKKQPDAKP